MKNKLIIIQLEMEDYICYELSNKTYKITMLNYNNIIPFVSKKIKNCDIYLQGFSRAEEADFQTNIYDYLLENNLNKVNYYIGSTNISIPDYISKNKLKPKDNKKKMLIVENEDKFICYEFDNETYSMTTLNTIKMIKKVSDNLDRYYIYFSCISRAELAYIVSKVREYYKFNKLDMNILNNSVFTIVNQKKLIKDIITNRKFVKKFDNFKEKNVKRKIKKK